MTKVELKKLKAELLRVQAARAEMEYVVEQRLEEIGRLQENMKKQDETEKMLLDKLGE